MYKRQDLGGALGPPADKKDPRIKRPKASNKATGAEYIEAGADALDSIMGAVSFFTKGETPAQNPPQEPPPSNPTTTNNKGVIVGGIVLGVLLLLIIAFLAFRKPAIPVA